MGFKEEMEKVHAKHYSTWSDAGSVKFGNDDFQAMYPNDYGDCGNDVYIIEEKFSPKVEDFKILGNAIGKFNLYSHDCGNKTVAKLEGNYLIYKHRRHETFLALKIRDLE